MFWRTPSASRAAEPTSNESAVTPRIPDEYADLWDRLSRFEIDDPDAEFPLSKRLAQEQAWKLDYALRVVEEYRRFMFLCMISEKMCTPSLAVDEAWHLHLIYTKSYWEGLCLRTLGRLIHHEPAQGGTADEAKFEELYITTLELYSRVFGDPPEDIWGRNKGRRRKPAACAAIRTKLSPGPPPENENELLRQIEAAAKRLKQFGS
ncbi:MAG: hypothetical protein K2W95_25275 [Candidatus Obscuribacterales bacterium]|nr:hypothetical protein [Candidatus Obscuribacterales bacterium]